MHSSHEQFGQPGSAPRLDLKHRVAPMADAQIVAQLLRGASVWNRWKHSKANPYSRDKIDLTQANLEGVDLTGADLGNVDLRGAILRGALLGRTNFERGDLREANLRASDLIDADVSDARLDGADLSEANLHGAKLTRATLSDADFTHVQFSETSFTDVNLSAARNLDTCYHGGPSGIDVRTLAKSPNLPINFLRGCGLPDILIEYLPSLFSQAIQFYSCFISYSSKDELFAQRLHADLQNNGVRCWFAPHNIQGGKRVREQLDEAIRVFDRLLLILSDHSMQSEWVKTEIARALRREREEKRRVLFPVSLVGFEAVREWEFFDEDSGRDFAKDIRAYFIPDFSDWKNHDGYVKTFERLFARLKDGKGRAFVTLNATDVVWSSPSSWSSSASGSCFVV